MEQVVVISLVGAALSLKCYRNCNIFSFVWPLNCKLGGVNPKREFTQDGKGLLGMGSRPAERGRKEREFHRIVSPRGVTQLDST